MPAKFKALFVREEDGMFTRNIEDVPFDYLPDHEVTVRVKYSGLNFKDALSATGNKGVSKNFPHIPGIDAAGIVEDDKSGQYRAGDAVIVTSYDLGMNTPGGFGEYIRIPADWVVPLPAGIDLEEAMILGTAGLTAGFAIYKMEVLGSLKPTSGDILVTGASGGVGSMAVAILSQEGFQVTASTGKEEGAKFLKSLGANEIVSREEVNDKSGRPLLKPRWAGVIDNVGGNTLTTALKTTKKDGCVISVGLVDSFMFESSVFPFILNGVSLMGINSATTDYDLRHEIWNKLALEWRPMTLRQMGKTVPLSGLNEWIDQILTGNVTGRIVVKHE
jgi:putative YhdH/YhfP family quinone oxidoreductase